MNTENTSLVVVRLSPSLRSRVQEAAKSQDRSLSAEIRRTLAATYQKAQR